ncbi:Oidioi.mRNA.OKI2018_I69.PAR.g12471.t1.cds [Oikopleura dioica]|uniref:Oidioi.mRNA.OKI2018_I69.PAR.g12471.t1.cds n=1 Tax=Oikopleura dioica TaxID=34765 RepID=A0ABN7S0T2_OIKDI|nr:Oidioi.mRNA.OKI2018_I69.PAR.g12471.t1.cds [Oikopleura dioica]
MAPDGNRRARHFMIQRASSDEKVIPSAPFIPPPYTDHLRANYERRSSIVNQEIISDGTVPPAYRPRERPSGRRRSLSAEDPASFWQRVYKTESIDSEEAKKLFVKFAKKKLFYGTKPAKTGITDQIQPSVALTVELFTLVERRQKRVVHEAIESDLEAKQIEDNDELPPASMWDVHVDVPKFYPDFEITRRIVNPGTEKIVGCDECEDCWNCNAEGIVSGTRQEARHIMGNNGMGSIQVQANICCMICGGRGTETCTMCGGDGHVRCDKCDQRGKVKQFEEIVIDWLTIKDYEMIGDAPVPVKWVYSRKSKKVLDLDFNSSNELCNPSNFPDDVNFVMKGLSKKIKSKAKADKLKIHRQKFEVRKTPLHTVHYMYKKKPNSYVISGYDKKVFTSYYPGDRLKCSIM